MRAPRSLLVGAVAVLASAATTSDWADWQPLTGSGGAFTTSVDIAAQPELSATVTSDSRAGQVGVISGATVWLAQGTDVGAKYGTSQGQPYLNLRPKADTATSPSTTTYSFNAPTPTSGWTFVLGDIDADSVRIQAIGTDGQPLQAADLGFRGGFNYCAPGIAGKPGCTGAATDVPTWNPTTLTLTGNAAAADTSGSAAWFEPSTPITSLSFIFTRRSGFPVYQTWFASLARDITGSVVDIADGPLDGVTLTLTDGNGTVVGTTTSAPDGTYSFPGFVATDGYTVRVSPPTGKIATTATVIPADLTDTDAVADFEVRDIIPVAVSGQVVDDGGTPIAGVSVTIDGQTTTTGADGRYLFDQIAVGTHTATITAPPGFTITSAPPEFEVPDGSEEPIEDVDFVLAENPTLSGTVTSNGTGVAGVTVTATSPGGTLTTVTDGTGGYTFPRLPAGDYDIAITTPDGYVVDGPSTRPEQVAADDVTDVDFALARLGAFSGTVTTDDGGPFGGVTIEVTGPGGPQQLTTDADGAFGLGSLEPGTYTLTVVPPDDTTVVGTATRTLTITAAGEAIVDLDFVLAADEVVPTPTPTPTDTVTPTTDPGNGGVRLPATGLGPETVAWAIGGGVVLVLGATLLIAARRRSNRD
ncbi:Serine-aspartate repeat-containing protein F [Microbacterium oxydans]|uniref:MSCRAMM family protein n=1 Tax=Microbacterium oxydans TaxID=82380 RepID=UPI001D781C77|nr:carboxypeptidase regulatory-like domain-containing protein [Microbacterium oxydans]CAH0235619.1 Serine-aspartate repeat-containing protein F [Microbacterium oxydans]